MQLTEGVNKGCHPRWRINEAGAEAGEGQVSAKLPDVLLLWRCAEDLPCCERHGEPAVEEGLPGYVSGSSRRPMILAWRAVSWARMSTRAMPPWSTALLETSLLG